MSSLYKAWLVTIDWRDNLRDVAACATTARAIGSQPALGGSPAQRDSGLTTRARPRKFRLAPLRRPQLAGESIDLGLAREGEREPVRRTRRGAMHEHLVAVELLGNQG
jgi:hypothetical protein